MCPRWRLSPDLLPWPSVTTLTTNIADCTKPPITFLTWNVNLMKKDVQWPFMTFHDFWHSITLHDHYDQQHSQLHNTTINFSNLNCQSDDRKRPSITLLELPWLSMTFHHLLWPIIKTWSNVRTSLIWTQINSHLTPRLVLIVSKSSLIYKHKLNK